MKSQVAGRSLAMQYGKVADRSLSIQARTLSAATYKRRLLASESVIRTWVNAIFDATRNQQFFLNFQPFNTTTNCTVSTDGQTQLCIPGPGQTSNIGRNFFRQGINANLNAMIGKTFRVTEGQSLQARLEMQNVTNSEMYDTFGSQSIQSNVFTRLNVASDGVLVNSPRRMQLSLKYSF